MFKAKITNIEKLRHQATGKDFLDVTVDVIEMQTHTITKKTLTLNPTLADEGYKIGDEVELPVTVSTQKHMLDPEISKEGLLEVVEKIRAGWQLEQEQKLANAKDNAINENINKLREELVGSEVAGKIKK